MAYSMTFSLGFRLLSEAADALDRFPPMTSAAVIMSLESSLACAITPYSSNLASLVRFRLLVSEGRADAAWEPLY